MILKYESNLCKFNILHDTSSSNICLIFSRTARFNTNIVVLILYKATATIAGNPAIVEAMIKEHEEHVMEVFRTIDRLANQYEVWQ